MRTRTRNAPDETMFIGPGMVEEGNLHGNWYSLYHCPQRTMTSKSDSETIIDSGGGRQIGSWMGSKDVEHTRVRKEAFWNLQEVEAHTGALSAQNRAMFQGGHWEIWKNQFNLAYFWGLSHDNLDFRWPENDAHMVNVAVSSFFSNVNEVDGLLNIIEAPDLIPGMRSIVERLGLPLSHPENRKIWERANRALLDSRKLQKRRIASNADMRPLQSRLLKEAQAAIEDIRLLKFCSMGTASIKTTADLISRVWMVNSAGILTWSFAIAPLVSDCQKVMSALPGLQDKLAKLSDKASIVKTSRLQVPVPLTRLILSRQSLPGVATFREEGTATSNYVWWFPHPEGATDGVYRVTVRGSRPRIRSSSKTIQSLDYFMRRFGSSGPANLAWELVPFSFVSDWFIDVNTLLGVVDGYLTNGYSVDDICISQKYDVNIVITHVGSRTGWFSMLDGSDVGYVRLERYKRVAWKNGYDAVFFNSRFGKKQGLLTGALLTEVISANLKSSTKHWSPAIKRD